MDSHHARLCVVLHNRETYIEKLKAECSESAEVVCLKGVVFSIGEVRKLIEMAYQKPINKEYRLFLIDAYSIAIEAQHALLKILEEPPQTSKFIFVLQSKSQLLPTLLSRVSLEESKTESLSEGAFSDFVTMAIGQRMEYIAKITKDKNDDILRSLERGLIDYVQLIKVLELKKTILDSLQYLQLRGTSKKMVWEELSLTLPVANEK